MATFAEQLAEYTAWVQFQEKTPEAFEEHQALILTDKRVRFVLEKEGGSGEDYFSRDSLIGVLEGEWDDVVEDYFATTKGIEGASD